MSQSRLKSAIFSIITVVVLVVLVVGIGEVVVRLKNRSMRNYDIEMWRYARELKRPSQNPILGHEHIPSSAATLQSVLIRLNERGLRGGAIKPTKPGMRRILFLGGSFVLGWGTPEEKTMSSRIEQMFLKDGNEVEALNAGVGNYNLTRAVELFFAQLSDLHPTDLVVLCFQRDVDILGPGGGNFFLRHSQLAVTVWTAVHKLTEKQTDQELEEHYRKAYAPDAPGFLAMQQSLTKLSAYAREHRIRLYLAMCPTVHNLDHYHLKFAHEIMRKMATDYGYKYIDLLPPLLGIRPEQILAMPGDPHPNALGHEIMARTIYPILKQIN